MISEALWTPMPRGSRLDADHPSDGVLFPRRSTSDLFLVVEDRTTLTAVTANATGKTRVRVGGSYDRATADLCFPQLVICPLGRLQPTLVHVIAVAPIRSLRFSTHHLRKINFSVPI